MLRWAYSTVRYGSRRKVDDLATITQDTRMTSSRTDSTPLSALNLKSLAECTFHEFSRPHLSGSGGDSTPGTWIVCGKEV